MTPELDKSIDVAIDKTDLNYQGSIRKFSQALIADLLKGLDARGPQDGIGKSWNGCLRFIRNRVGIGGDTPAPITPERVLLNECVQAAALAGCESPGAPSAPAIQAMVRVLTKGLSGPEVRAVLQRVGIGGE